LKSTRKQTAISSARQPVPRTIATFRARRQPPKVLSACTTRVVFINAKWPETVTRMVGYAAGSTGALQPGEDQQIMDYLADTQTPEAVNRRKAQADAASSAGRSLIAEKAAASNTP
jgi:hypothetical protein